MKELAKKHVPDGYEVRKDKDGKHFVFNLKTKKGGYAIPDDTLPRGWKKYIDDDNKNIYYYCEDTKASIYDRPSEPCRAASGAVAANDMFGGGGRRRTHRRALRSRTAGRGKTQRRRR